MATATTKKTAAAESDETRGAWSQGWRRALKYTVAAIGIVMLLGLAGFAYAYNRIDIPSPNSGFESQATKVYYSDGKTEMGKFAEQNRTNVDLKDVPEHVQAAIIAAEDRTFETNAGIDPKGIIRAAFNNASGGDTQGASTITQQYVKVFYLSQERTFSRKVKEAILSLKIQRQLSKEEVLEGYMNTIFFGRGSYGIEAAAQTWFGRGASELTVKQGAFLSAIINSPNNFDPAEGKAAKRALKARYGYVLDGMSQMGTMPSKAAGKKKLYNLPKFKARGTDSQYGGQRGHMLTLVRNELIKQGFSDKEIDSGGLQVRTTFTEKAMTAAAEGVAEVAPDLKGLHAAVASVEPGTGALRGMYAGQDYLDSQINWAKAGGAPGSTFKPFSLVTALRNGFALDSVFDGDSPLEVGGTEFSNQGEGLGKSYGKITLEEATEDSVNTAYVQMVDAIPDGPNRVIENAVSMGVDPDSPGLDANLSMVLGSATVSLFDMANGYATIASGGEFNEVYVLEQVKNAEGKNVYKRKGKPKEVFDTDVAADASYALQQVASEGTAGNANVIGRPIAGKTGTATSDDGRVRSSVFVGYTPQLATAVMYTRGNGNAPLDGFLPTFFGGEYPARTWAAVMSRAMEGLDIVEFPPKVGITATADDFAPSPSPTPTESEEEKDQEEQPSQEPSPTPEPTPSTEPTPTPEPTPTETTEPAPGGGGGGGPGEEEPPPTDPDANGGGSGEQPPAAKEPQARARQTGTL